MSLPHPLLNLDIINDLAPMSAERFIAQAQAHARQSLHWQQVEQNASGYYVPDHCTDDERRRRSRNFYGPGIVTAFNVRNITGPHAITYAQADTVYERIKSTLHADRPIRLHFACVDMNEDFVLRLFGTLFMAHWSYMKVSLCRVSGVRNPRRREWLREKVCQARRTVLGRAAKNSSAERMGLVMNGLRGIFNFRDCYRYSMPNI